MNTSIELLVEFLINKQNRKYDFLLGILSLTNRQAKGLKEDGMQLLEKITDEKQVIIDKVNKIDEEYYECFNKLKSELGVKDLNELKGTNIKGISELKSKAAKIVDVIKQIMKVEEENNNKMVNLLGSLGTEIKKINQVKMINKAYGNYTTQSPPSYFIDKKK